jgi:hypothetical protein
MFFQKFLVCFQLRPLSLMIENISLPRSRDYHDKILRRIVHSFLVLSKAQLIHKAIFYIEVQVLVLGCTILTKMSIVIFNLPMLCF